MQCLYPITVPRYQNYKDPVSKVTFSRVYGFISVPCNRCPACRRRIQNEWAFRCMEEAKQSRLCAFIGLSYNDEHLPLSGLGEMTLNKKHLQRFFKNLRYNVPSIRYFSCGEYGDSFDRPHYHALIFVNDNVTHDQLKSFVEKRWIHGFIDYVPTVTPANAKYCCKYAMKSLGFDYGDCVPPFALMSRRPGIGKCFLDTIDPQAFRQKNLWVVHDQQGTPYPIPRIYKDYLYDKDEREVHNLELSELLNSKADYAEIEFGFDNNSNYYKFEFDRIQAIEKRFIDSLKSENYQFKRKAKQNVTRNKFDNSVFDDFHDFD